MALIFIHFLKFVGFSWNFGMYEYKIPQKSAHMRRKQFHLNQRSQQETSYEWFCRVFDAVNGCEFGEYGDFMLIDKFFAGLNSDAFKEYTLKTVFTIDDALSIGFKTELNNENKFEVTSLLENSDETQEHLPTVHIKVEVSNGFILNYLICRILFKTTKYTKKCKNYPVKSNINLGY